MNYSNQTLYLTIVKGPWYRSVRIGKISRKKPAVGIGQALVRLNIRIPDGCLNPPEVTVEIKPEHITQAPVTVQSEGAR